MSNTNKKIVIGLCGRKRAGKTTLADAMSYWTEKHAVADSLKDLCCEIIGVDRDRLEEMKAAEMPAFPDSSFDAARVSDIVSSATGCDIDVAERLIAEHIAPVAATISARTLLQVLGTEVIRSIDEGWHVDKVIEKIEASESTFFVIDDVRFPSEVDAITKRFNALFFYIIRPDTSIPVSNHPSETALTYHMFEPSMILTNFVSGLTPETAKCGDEQAVRMFTAFADDYIKKVLNDQIIKMSGVSGAAAILSENGFVERIDMSGKCPTIELCDADDAVRLFECLNDSAESAKARAAGFSYPTTIYLDHPFVIEDLKAYKKDA